MAHREDPWDLDGNGLPDYLQTSPLFNVAPPYAINYKAWWDFDESSIYGGDIADCINSSSDYGYSEFDDSANSDF